MWRKRFAFGYALALLASPAAAWEFTPSPVCTLTYSDASVDVVVTFDPAIPEYSITLTTPRPWPQADQFGLTFAGPRGLSIGTDRHVLSDDRFSLTVTDTGFGNVLDGLQFNEQAIGASGDAQVTVDLTDAAPAVAAFRACPADVTS